MAAVRLEAKAFNDARIKLLANKLGVHRHQVLGALAEIWSCCTDQNVYSLNSTIIDAVAERIGFATALCECGLGQWVSDKTEVKLKGVEGRVEWLQRLRENGKKGGRRKKSAKSGDSKTRIEPDANQTPTRIEPESNPLTITTTLTTTTSPSNKKIKNKELKELESADSLQHRIKLFIAAYVTAFQKRYPNSRPDISGQVIGQIKNFLKPPMSFDRSLMMIQVYLQMEDKWFKTKHYDIQTFLQNLNKVSVALDSGKDPDQPKSFKDVYEEHKAREKASHGL